MRSEFIPSGRRSPGVYIGFDSDHANPRPRLVQTIQEPINPPEYIGVNWNGNLLMSDDLISWEESFTNWTARDAAFGNGVYVIVGFGGRCAVSSDRITWSEYIVGESDRLFRLEFYSGYFYAVDAFEQDPKNTLNIYRSSDGKEWSLWSSISSVNYFYFNDILFTDTNCFVTTIIWGGSGLEDGIFISNNNGESWSLKKYNNLYYAGKFNLMSNKDGSKIFTNLILPTDSTPVLRVSSDNFNTLEICYSAPPGDNISRLFSYYTPRCHAHNGHLLWSRKYYVTDNSMKNDIIKSVDDGITWNSYATGLIPYGPYCLTFDGERYIVTGRAVGTENQAVLAVSNDGETWTKLSPLKGYGGSYAQLYNIIRGNI